MNLVLKDPCVILFSLNKSQSLYSILLNKAALIPAYILILISRDFFSILFYIRILKYRP